MKANLLLVVSVLLSGCSVSVTPNKTTVDTIVETFEFRVTNKEVAMDKSVNFVNQINLQYPKSTFAINYDAKESQFVDGFVKEIKAKGVNKLRYTLNANSESKGVKIVAKYHKMQEQTCDAVSFNTLKHHLFGCSLEYNRRLSMTNPVAE
ncbi:hypothetical protein [Vibrio diabolicus]|uniref:hypothetical protein n=1 Tax=Vibrio diabolicus TaxID=50719 RepID=UPI003D7DD79D